MGNTENKEKYRGGKIWLHRSIINWEWYTDSVTMRVFLHCILRANWKDGKWRGIEIKRGSFVTSRRKLAEELSLTEREVRTALDHLETTNEVTKYATAKYTVITVVKYDDYQTSDQLNDQQTTSKTSNNRPTKRQLTTTNEESKKERKKDEYIKPPKKGWIKANSHSARYVLDHPSDEGWVIEVVDGVEWGHQEK